MRRTHDDIRDELLVLRCQDGDGDAMRTLIARWQPRLTRLAMRLTAERETALDIVQDTWLAIVRGLRRLDDPARFRSWAYRIVTNKCADWIRRRVVQRTADRELASAASSNAGSSDTANAATDIDPLRIALGSLPVEQRAILSLRYLDGMSVIEIADVLGIPAGTVKSRLHHARGRLRRAMERVET